MTVKHDGMWKQTSELAMYDEELHLSDQPNQLFTEDLDDVMAILD